MPKPPLEPTKPRVHIGTSGWSYKDWVGPFYPEGSKPASFLPLYAERFSIVEVDSTFYGAPRLATVESWAAKSPEGFRFAPKVPGIVTHGAEGQRPNPERVLRDLEALDRFLETMSALGEKLGPVLFQFPYFKVGTLVASEFYGRLGEALTRLPEGLRAAVEVRNKGWIDARSLGLLRAHGACAVLLDHPYMPPPKRQLALGMGELTDFAYIRLLGDRYAIERTTKTWEKTVVDRADRLDEWAEVIESIVAAGSEVYTFSNNHYAGHGPATCRELAARI